VESRDGPLRRRIDHSTKRNFRLILESGHPQIGLRFELYAPDEGASSFESLYERFRNKYIGAKTQRDFDAVVGKRNVDLTQ
jgi:hypothetical protein